jgi:arginase
MKQLIVIEAPFNLGLKKSDKDPEPGVKFLPRALMANGFLEKTGIRESTLVPPPAYAMDIDPASGVRNADKIAVYSKALGAEVYRRVTAGYIPIVIGGDCSILIGSALGLKKKGRYGLFFIDGHTDYMWPQHSATKAAAGMDLALATGNGHDKLCNIDGLKPYVQEEDVFCFGNRTYDPDYVSLVRKSRIHYYDLKTLRQEGITAITARFLQMVANKKLDGFWVHIDADVLNDDIMPCVDSREKDGLHYAGLAETLAPLLRADSFGGLEITIVDPTLDKENKYVPEFTRQFAGMLRVLQH